MSSGCDSLATISAGVKKTRNCKIVTSPVGASLSFFDLTTSHNIIPPGSDCCSGNQMLQQRTNWLATEPCSGSMTLTSKPGYSYSGLIKSRLSERVVAGEASHNTLAQT